MTGYLQQLYGKICAFGRVRAFGKRGLWPISVMACVIGFVMGLMPFEGINGVRAFSAELDQTVLLSDLDIPVMPDFKEEEDSRIIFDTAGGRIIEARASGPNAPNEVIVYYRAILPTLSWQIITQRTDVPVKGGCEGQSHCITATLAGEILIINAVENKDIKIPSINKTTVYFSVNPE